MFTTIRITEIWSCHKTMNSRCTLTGKMSGQKPVECAQCRCGHRDFVLSGAQAASDVILSSSALKVFYDLDTAVTLENSALKAQ